MNPIQGLKICVEGGKERLNKDESSRFTRKILYLIKYFVEFHVFYCRYENTECHRIYQTRDGDRDLRKTR